MEHRYAGSGQSVLRITIFSTAFFPSSDVLRITCAGIFTGFFCLLIHIPKYAPCSKTIRDRNEYPSWITMKEHNRMSLIGSTQGIEQDALEWK